LDFVTPGLTNLPFAEKRRPDGLVHALEPALVAFPRQRLQVPGSWRICVMPVVPEL